LPLKVQNRGLELIRKVLGGIEEQTPAWLMRPAAKECGRCWPLINKIYLDLTGLHLPSEMPERERRKVDCVLKQPNGESRIIEVDESQHFNLYRAKTLKLYPDDVLVAFDRNIWIKRSEAKKRLEGGGFGKSKPPLFPGEGGRHRQRAFRDALADILPPEYGFKPTLRLAYFEVDGWLAADSASEMMADLLRNRGLLS
jgi:hypothetical protein